MNELETADSGEFVLGTKVEIGYYDQENRGLSDTNTVFGELREAYPDKTDLELRSTLALFLFDADDCERSISTLSGGERARLTLAKLILKKVNLLIMDEPTSGLDPISTKEVKTLIRALADGGMTILTTSHLLADAEDVCDRVMIVNHGKAWRKARSVNMRK